MTGKIYIFYLFIQLRENRYVFTTLPHKANHWVKLSNYANRSGFGVLLGKTAHRRCQGQ